MEEKSRNEIVIKKLNAQLEQAASQKERIDTLATLAWELRISQPDRSAELARKAIELAQVREFLSSPYLDGKVAGLVALSFVYLQLGELNEGTNLSLKALKTLDLSRESITAAHLWLTLAQNSTFLGDFTSVRNHTQRTLEITEQLSLPIERAWALDALAIADAMQADYPNALVHHREAIGIFKQANDIDGRLRAKNNLAMTLYKQGEYDEALSQILVTLQNAKVWNRKFDILNIACTAAQICIDTHRLDDAERHLHTAFSNAEILENTRAFHIFVLMEWARLSQKRNETDKAKSYFLQSLVLAEENDQLGELAHCYQELSKIYLQEGAVQRAEKYAQMAKSFQDDLAAKHAEYQRKIQVALEKK